MSYIRSLVLTLILTLPVSSFSLERTSLLPPDAQSYIRISNTTNFWNSLKKSSFGKLWRDPQFQDFAGNPDAETWQELFLKDEDDNVWKKLFFEQLKMLNGEVILAFDLENEAPYIIATFSKEAFERSLDLDEQMTELMDQPFDIVRDTFQDVVIIEHITYPESNSPTHSWQAHVDSTLILGNSREWVEQCIVRLQKEKVEEPKGNPSLNLNLRLSDLIEKTISKGTSGIRERALLSALGILDVEKLSSKLELKETQLVIDNELSIGGFGKGLFTLLDVEPSELPTVTFIPENIASLEVGRFNLIGFWREIPNVLSAVQPEMKFQFDMLLAMIQQQTGINLEQDLLIHLGKKYIAFSTVEENQQISVAAIELKDGISFKKGIDTALSTPGMQPYVASGINLTDFLNHTIYTPKNNNPTESFGFALTDDYLLYGNPNGLRQVIRSLTSEIAANETFEQNKLVKELRSNVPSRAFAYSAIDWKQSMDTLIKQLSKSEYYEQVQRRWAMSGNPLPPPNFNLIPSSDHIASFFEVSYQYIEATSDGLHQQITLKY